MRNAERKLEMVNSARQECVPKRLRLAAALRPQQLVERAERMRSGPGGRSERGDQQDKGSANKVQRMVTRWQTEFFSPFRSRRVFHAMQVPEAELLRPKAVDDISTYSCLLAYPSYTPTFIAAWMLKKCTKPILLSLTILT